MANEIACDLSTKSCKPCEGGVPPLSAEEVERLLAQISGWECADGQIAKTYRFKDYYQTMAFVNATAWVSHHEDHHPDLEVGYNQCRVRYHTHAINGLSENDFICAAKIDALLNG
ncbi:MAG: 4a-hydroxytetrahydrobiopterin dehydratase [Sulfuricella sp.]|nr:4a-hydroxytetrahydrobiopterin dehydratase [Sulfuricella sp.]